MPRHVSSELTRSALFAAAFLVAVGGLIYELILGTAASFLFGDSIVSFSLATGITLFGMGIGSLLSSRLKLDGTRAFVVNEVVLGLIGGFSVLILFATFSLTPYYWLAFVVLSVAIGICIGLEIPLMMRLFKERAAASTLSLLGKVLALDYFGALAASLIFPFVLLPVFGLLRTAFLVASLNILIALYILSKAKMSKMSCMVTLGGLAVLIAGFMSSTYLEERIDAAAFKDPVVYSTISPYQKIVLTQYRDDTRLYLNNNLQFSSTDEVRYHETLAHAVMTSVDQPRRVAILGGGDGLLAREILRYPSVQSVEVIDIDKAITDLASTHRLFVDLNRASFRNDKVTIHNEDAFTYLKNHDATYDAILIDLVDPSNEKIAKLYSKEFYRLALGRLSLRGVMMTQGSSSYFTPNAFATIAATVAAAGPQRKVVPLSVNVPSFGEWGFVLSVPAGGLVFGQTPLPTGLSYVSDKQLRAAADISIEYQDISPSTLLHPSIYTTYNRDMTKWRY